MIMIAQIVVYRLPRDAVGLCWNWNPLLRIDGMPSACPITLIILQNLETLLAWRLWLQTTRVQGAIIGYGGARIGVLHPHRTNTYVGVLRRLLNGI